MANMGTAFDSSQQTVAILYFDTGCGRSAPIAAKLTYTEACLAVEEAKERPKQRRTYRELAKMMAELDAEKAPKNRGYYAIKSALESIALNCQGWWKNGRKPSGCAMLLKPE